MHEQKVVFPITQHVLDHLNEAILITNQRGEIVAGSKVADEIFEISSAVGKPINRLLELTSLEESKQLTWLKHDRYKMIEVTVLPADSQNQYYYVRLQLVSNQMQAVRQQLDNFATAQFSGTLLYDKRSGNIMDCDTNGATMFHYSKQQLIFKPLSELFTSKLPDNFWREQENRKQVMHAHSAVTKEGERFFVDILYFDLSTETGVCLLKDVTEQVINKKRIEYLAYYDELTDLPNRHYFVHILSETIEKLNRKKDILAVYIVDLDYFKEVNDILGYAVGDELIRHSARRLKKFLDVDTFVARMVGDKFIIMQFGLSSKKEVMEFAEHQIQTFEEPVIINGYDIYTTVTIGVSLFPNHGTTAEDLIKHANSAMYESKNNHRNSYKLFEAAISEKFQSTITLESELRQAIKQKQLELHYQPQVDFNTNQIIGMEALLRWKHPEKGYIAPGEFIGIAEKTGLIIEIGEWVMYEACRQNKLWQDQGYQPITISVNLSAIQFHQKDFLQKVKQIIQKTELLPAYLELEITETMAMTNEQTVLHTLWELRKLGIPVSIDDFGTGYSSLKLLSLFPITKLKIDKMFMEQSEENQIIVKSIIHLCHLLKLKVVAEGVETEEQFAFLKAEQCDQLQGYYFSKALPANQAQQLLVKR